MATPHLTSRSASKASDRTLNGVARGSARHLLILRQTASYSDTALVSRATSEKYCSCAAWGQAQYYSSNVSNLISQDAEQIVTVLNNRLAQSSWSTGHKSVFSYWARSGCPGYLKQNGSATTTILERYLEAGASRNLMRFDLRFIPLGMFTTKNVYLRWWYPSFVQTLADGTATLHWQSNKEWARMRYRFLNDADAAAAAPSQLESSTYWECAFDGGFANGGKGQGTPVATDGVGLDPWHLPPPSAAWTYGDGNVDFYADESQTSGGVELYYKDYQLPAAAVAQLAQAAGATRHVWLFVGPKISDGISSNTAYGTQQGSTLTQSALNVELVFRLSGPAYNT